MNFNQMVENQRQQDIHDYCEVERFKCSDCGSNWAEENEDLCFDCHEEQAALEAKEDN